MEPVKMAQRQKSKQFLLYFDYYGWRILPNLLITLLNILRLPCNFCKSLPLRKTDISLFAEVVRKISILRISKNGPRKTNKATSNHGGSLSCVLFSFTPF